MRWVEYTNYGGRSHYADLRRRHGHQEPYGVRLWGLGNEVYGRWQMGHRPAERYAADAREHALFMRAVDPTLRLVAVGSGPGERMEDQEAGRARCCARPARWWTTSPSISTGPATTCCDGPQRGRRVPEHGRPGPLLRGGGARPTPTWWRLKRGGAGVQRPLALALDEWNIRHLEPASWPVPQPGADGGIAPRDLPPAPEGQGPGRTRVNRWSPRTAADALFYAGVLPRPAAPLRARRAGGDGQHGQPDQRQRPAGGAPGRAGEERHLPRLGPACRTTPAPSPCVPQGAGRRPCARCARGRAQTPPVTLATRPALVPYPGRGGHPGRRTGARCTSRRSTATGRRTWRRAWCWTAAPGRCRPRRRAHVPGRGRGRTCWRRTPSPAPDAVALRDLGTVDVTGGRYRFPAHSVTVLSFALT